MYERRPHPPLPLGACVARVGRHAALPGVIVFESLLVGMAGYGSFANLAWRDAFLNAAMLLGGMGPVESPQSPGGKLFAGVYALYAGLAFIAVTGIMLAPIVHRILHRFRWERSARRERSAH